MTTVIFNDISTACSCSMNQPGINVSANMLETLPWVSTQPLKKRNRKVNGADLYGPFSNPPPFSKHRCVIVFVCTWDIEKDRGRGTLQSHDESKIKRQAERGSVSKLRQITDVIQTNFVPEGNSAATDVLRSLDNGPHPGRSEQTGGT